jgi:hypothetical protein
MKTHKMSTLCLAVMASLATQFSPQPMADEIGEALSSGKASVDLRLRYEEVDQDNGLKDASALTLRTLLGYSTGSVNGFSAMVEFEDNRIVLGGGDYSVPQVGYNSGIYSVIADPETTELDQGYVQYQSDKLKVKVGRQVITYDGHRFVGHVGWRQDRQTFDGVSAQYSPTKDMSLNYAYISQRNRIFAQDLDLDAKDHLLNGAYKTSLGTLVAYAYLLEVDNNSKNSLDTFGMSFTGSTMAGDTKLLYSAEYANQSSETASTDFDADYMMLEAGAVFGGITAKVGVEVLGSDDGSYGFSTPLATLHKFNGWSDQFLNTPAQGLVDVSLTLAGSLAGGGWTVVYHDFSADEATTTVDDLGTELDLQYVHKYGKYYSAGIKYAAYSGEGGRVDTDKLWLWVGAKF